MCTCACTTVFNDGDKERPGLIKYTEKRKKTTQENEETTTTTSAVHTINIIKERQRLEKSQPRGQSQPQAATKKSKRDLALHGAGICRRGLPVA